MSPDAIQAMWLIVTALAALVVGSAVATAWTRRRLGAALAGARQDLTRREIAEQRLEAQVRQLTAVTESDAVALAALQSQQDDFAALRSRIQQIEAQSAVIERLYDRISELEPQAARGRELVALMGAWQSAAAAATSDASGEPLDESSGVLDAVPAQLNPTSPDPATEALRTAKPEPGDDDLTRVAGIGPGIEALCKEAGIRTWQDLAATPVERLREIIASAGPRFARHRPDVWPAQAAALVAARAAAAAEVARVG